VEASYPGTLTAAAAKDRKKELESRKEVKDLLKARELFEQAAKLKEKGKPDLAKKKLEELVRRFPATKYAELARAELGAGAAAGG
jgi:outer membrane protein assembly factor BamD (BamD/ComL family)